ncbi:MAG: HAMP domain-containing histidine kinase [Candidatus Aminicenantes bacterium]|nr:HAMP domain-containing histidine kinase [Candidatus Aminicenantes bacterium]
MSRRSFILYFLLPFLGIALVLLAVSSLDRAYIQGEARGLVLEQLRAAAQILISDISRFLEEGDPPDRILERYARDENIYYMALLDGAKSIVGWRSRFEGYLPLSLDDARRRDAWQISSPAGGIYNLFLPFDLADGRRFHLYLGYSLEGVENIARRSRRTLLLTAVALFSAGLLFARALFRLQKRYLAKAVEAEDHRREKERFREISALTSGVAHEIKNPLNSLSLLCELMKRSAPPGLEEEIRLGGEEIRRIAGIVDRFSQFVKPLHVERRPFPLLDSLTEAAGALAGEFPALTAFRPTVPSGLTVPGDRELLTGVWANILRNALEASGGLPVEVRAETRRRAVLVRFRDTGPGLPPEVAARVFDPFFTTKKSGMGIGLYLSKKVVEAHGGRIGMTSGPGRGTIFEVELPGG